MVDINCLLPAVKPSTKLCKVDGACRGQAVCWRGREWWHVAPLSLQLSDAERKGGLQTCTMTFSCPHLGQAWLQFEGWDGHT